MKTQAMVQPTFADRYAEAGLTANAQIINDRTASMKRIVASITDNRAKVLDLAGAYYENPEVDLNWFRDEITQDDVSFSLVNNAREARILAAIALGELVAKGDAIAILAVIAGHVAGNVRPAQAEWLITAAKGALGRYAVSNRTASPIATKVSAPQPNKELAGEIEEVGSGEWEVLVPVLGKIRAEAQASINTTSTQTSNVMAALSLQMRLMREETQILWWLFGEHSRHLMKRFANFDPQQSALVGALDLATLTTVSTLGPIAAPAMLERVIALSKKPKGSPARSLSATVDSFAIEDLQALSLQTELPPKIAPVTTAIELARTIGHGAWYARFKVLTDLDATTVFDPLSLSEQLYREHLLGQLK